MIGYIAAFASGALVVFFVLLAWSMCRVAAKADRATAEEVARRDHAYRMNEQ